LKLLIITGMVVGIIGCSTEGSYKASEQLTAPYITEAQTQKENDDALAKRLNNVLNDQLKPSAIKVVVNDYYVLLVGQVASNGDKLQAETICKRWPGTKTVYNYLTIAIPPQIPSVNLTSSLSKDVMVKIKEKYDLNPDNISVTTVDGVVYLLGSNVGNLTTFNSVITSIYTLPKVTKVVNLERSGDLDYSTAN
jgi:osmotically-inducible protein OsmY